MLLGRVVVYAYSRTGRPGVENPAGWDMIPGARGCTPQSCSFRDRCERSPNRAGDFGMIPIKIGRYYPRPAGK